jgi:hypothetical protein
MKSFKQFLLEINYGQYEKDNRFQYLKKLIIKDMLKVIEKYPTDDYITYQGTIQKVPIFSKYITNRLVYITVNWKLRKPKSINIGGGNFIFKNAEIESIPEDNEYDITINCNNYGLNPKQYIKKVKEGIQSSRIDAHLYHEIQHLLNYVDHKVGKYYKYKHPLDDSLEEYFSQDNERHNWLTSVIHDLASIKEETPEISFTDAIAKSEDYKKFIPNLRKDLRNHFKNKIAYFWYSNYDDGKHIGEWK